MAFSFFSLILVLAAIGIAIGFRKSAKAWAQKDFLFLSEQNSYGYTPEAEALAGRNLYVWS